MPGFLSSILGGLGGSFGRPRPTSGGPAYNPGGLESFNAPYSSGGLGYGGLQEGTAGLQPLSGKNGLDKYQPDLVSRALITGPAAQDWANPYDRLFTGYVDAARAGEASQLRNIGEGAANANLGRAYAGQLQAQVGQATTQAISQASLQAQEAQAARRFALQRMLAASMIDRMTNVVEERRFKKALKAQKEAADQAFFGNIFGGLLGAAGSVFGAGAAPGGFLGL